MRSPRLVSPARKVALAVTLLSLSGAAALSASVPAPQSQVDPEAQKKAREQAIQSAIALVHDEAGFSDELPIGTFSDATPDARSEIARAARHVPEVVAAAIKRLDPAAPRTADPASHAAKKRLATFAGEHSFRRTLAWYEPLLVELAADMPEPKLAPEQLKAHRAQLREWQAKSPTYREWAWKRGSDLQPPAPAKPTNTANPTTGPFSDVPLTHPAYGAMNLMPVLGIFTGYPDNTFRGKRALTRYEFAVALQRIVQDLQRRLTERPIRAGSSSKSTQRAFFSFPVGAATLQLARSPIGPIGIPNPNTPKPVSIQPSQLPIVLAWVRALSEEFDTELAMLGGDVAQMKRSLDGLDEHIERLMPSKAPGKPQGTATGDTP